MHDELDAFNPTMYKTKLQMLFSKVPKVKITQLQNHLQKSITSLCAKVNLCTHKQKYTHIHMCLHLPTDLENILTCILLKGILQKLTF